MKKINQQAAKVFALLIEKLGDNPHMRIELEGYMPLVMKVLDKNTETPVGAATRYSLAHYYEKEGDLMRDPEMCFLVVDYRLDKEEVELMGIYPCYFLNDRTGAHQNSMQVENGQIISVNKVWQSDHSVFANDWLENIGQQGFLLMKPTHLS